MKPLTRKRPTISDVAEIANVSTATVSRALQNPDVVSDATRKLVFAAVRKTGYRANLAAKMLRQNRSGTILVVLPDIGNPFFSEILSGIEDAATRQEHTILIGNTNGESKRTRDLLEYLRNGRADGALLLNGELPVAPEEATALPVVSISEEIPGADISHVGTDNIQAAMDITNHLIGLGHTAITHISGPPGNVLSRQRMEGYRNAMTAGGLAERIQVVSGGFTLEDGKQSAGHLVNSDRRPTAIMCANDESAMGAAAALQARGIAVPEEVSITGFDDLAFAHIFSPALTTIRQSRKETGQQAMTLLLKMISEGPQQTRTVLVEHQLVIRASTCSPK